MGWPLCLVRPRRGILKKKVGSCSPPPPYVEMEVGDSCPPPVSPRATLSARGGGEEEQNWWGEEAWENYFQAQREHFQDCFNMATRNFLNLVDLKNGELVAREEKNWDDQIKKIEDHVGNHMERFGRIFQNDLQTNVVEIKNEVDEIKKVVGGFENKMTAHLELLWKDFLPTLDEKLGGIFLAANNSVQELNSRLGQTSVVNQNEVVALKQKNLELEKNSGHGASNGGFGPPNGDFVLPIFPSADLPEFAPN